MKRFWIFIFILLPSLGYSQDEVNLAREAAHPNITDNATYMVFRDGAFQTVIEGSNNFTCLVVTNPEGRSEPSCLNREAMNSVFYTYQLEMKLRYEGHSNIDALEIIAETFDNGELPTAEIGSIVYMESPNNKFYNFSNDTLGSTRPHQMYFYPKMSNETFSLNTGPVSLYQGYPHLTALLVFINED